MNPKWKYFTAMVPGDFHAAVKWLNDEHPDFDVVTMQATRPSVTLVVFRLPADAAAEPED